MLCLKPFNKGLAQYPCGQCLPCRINRRRLWASRIMLEAQSHQFSSFWTLTYDKENEPSDSSLNPDHPKNWLKRLRFALESSNRSVRYYLVGEYGDQTNRPHYHVALFGVNETEADLIRDTWGFGFVYGGTLTVQSAEYIAGYVTKKMTKKDDPRLKGRYPEFARMSLRPGIGGLSSGYFADTLHSEFGAKFIAETGDVPTHFHSQGKMLPLGRYMRQKIRQEVGFENLGGQERVLENQKEKMRQMQKDSGLPERIFTPPRDLNKIEQIKRKQRLYGKRDKL